jgi:hypothetical protein
METLRQSPRPGVFGAENQGSSRFLPESEAMKRIAHAFVGRVVVHVIPIDVGDHGNLRGEQLEAAVALVQLRYHGLSGTQFGVASDVA